MTWVASAMSVRQQYQSVIKQSFLATVLLLLALSGCTNSEDESKSEQAGLVLPQLIQRMTVPADGTLNATITIDKDTANAETRDMEVDVANNRLSFSGKVSSGTHSFLLELFYQSSSVNKIRLVSASRTINVASDQSLDFNDGEYIYDDRDDDTFTNVVEIESGSDPFTQSSFPDESVADDNYEPNNSYDLAYDISSHRGRYFNDSVEINTGAGRLTLSDNIDIFKITTTDSIDTIEVEVASDYGIRWNVYHFENGSAVATPGELTLNEDIGYSHQIVVLTTAQPRDYYLVFSSATDDLVEGSYSFGWD